MAQPVRRFDALQHYQVSLLVAAQASAAGPS